MKGDIVLAPTPPGSASSRSSKSVRQRMRRRRLRSDPERRKANLTAAMSRERIPARNITFIGCQGIRYSTSNQVAVQSHRTLDLLLSMRDVRVPSSVILSEFRTPDIDDFTAHMCRFGYVTDIPQSSEAYLNRAAKRIQSIEMDCGTLGSAMSMSRMLQVPLHKDTSPGIRMRAAGYKTKADTKLESLPEAWQRVEAIVGPGGLDAVESLPCGYAGRGKLVKPGGSVSTGKAEGRLVLMPDVVHHLVASMVSKTCTKSIKRLDKRLGGVMLGTQYFGGSWGEAFSLFKGTKSARYVCIDFSGFDASLRIEVLRVAMRIIKEKFRPAPERDKLFDYYLRELVETRVDTPSGLQYQKHKGVASGDPFTSLADSYANWLCILSVAEAMGVDARAWVFGDDCVITVEGYSGSNDGLLDELTVHFKQMFDLTVKPSQSYVCDRVFVQPDEDNPGDTAVSFLSFYCTTEGFPLMSTDSLWDRLVNPERCVSELGDEYSTAAGLLVVYFANKVASGIIRRVLWGLEDASSEELFWYSAEFVKDWGELEIHEDVRGVNHPLSDAALTELYVSGFISNFSDSAIY